MIFAQAATGFDASKSFNGHGLLTLGGLALVVTLFCNIDKIWNLYKNWKAKPSPNEVFNGVPLAEDLHNNEPPTEAEYRVMLFGWVDEIRSYAIETGNDTALVTANKLINDLLATPKKEVANVTTPKTTS